MSGPGNTGERRDRYVIGVALLIIGALVYSLYLDRYRRLEAGNAQLIGEMVHHSGSTRRRYADRALWESASTGDSLYDRNLIHTGQDSTSHLRLSDGTRIELGPQTLIVLHLRPAPDRPGPAIELRKGSVRVHRLRPKSAYRGELIVRHGERSAGMKNGSVNFQSVSATDDAGNHTAALRVHPELGLVHLYDDGASVDSIGPAEHALLLPKESRADRPAVQLLHPPQGALLSTAESNLNVTLLWKRNGGEERRGGELKIAKDPGFTNVVRHRALSPTSVEDGRADVNLSPGVYYWTLAAKNAGDPAVGFFRVQSTTEKHLTNLQPQRVDAERIAFHWERDPQALYYRLEVFSGDGRSLLSKKVQSNFATLRLTAGDYSYRVSSRRSPHSGEPGLESDAMAFRRLEGGDIELQNPPEHRVAGVRAERRRVPTTSRPQTLQLLYPYNGATVDMADVNVVAFHWSKGRADGVRFRLYDVGNGRALLHEETVNGNRLNFQDLRKLTNGGSYEWELEGYGRARFRISLSVQPDRPEFVRDTEAEPLTHAGNTRNRPGSSAGPSSAQPCSCYGRGPSPRGTPR